MEFIDIPLPNATEGPRDESISTQINYFPGGEYYEAELLTTAAYLKTLTKSDGFLIYNYDDILHELFVCPDDATTDSCFPQRYKWNIYTGETVACFALRKMSPILTDDHVSTDLNYPYIQDLPSLSPRYVMTLPIISFQKRSFGVVEFYRQDGTQYKAIEVRLSMFLLKNCAEAFKQNENTVFYKAYNNIEFDIQHMIESYACKNNNEDSYTFLYKVVQLAKKYTRASTTALLIERGGRFRKIVSTVQGFEVNSHIQGSLGLGFIVRSRLAVEFYGKVLHHKIRGMIRAGNKIGHSEFCALDKQILAGVAKMCTLWAVIEFQSGYLKKQKSLMKTLKKIINIQLKYCYSCGKGLGDLEPYSFKHLNSWSYSVADVSDKNKLVIDVVLMLLQVKKNLHISQNALKDFVVMIQECHGESETEHFKNTVMIVQSLYCLLNTSKGSVEGEVAITMMLATLCSNILVDYSPTAKSSIFGRYNKYAYELIRFEVAQYFIQDTKLFNDYDQSIQNDLLDKIKTYMVCTNLQKFKKNMRLFNMGCHGEDPIFLQQDQMIKQSMYKVLPGLAGMLYHFRSEKFAEMFPNFFLNRRLSDENISYVEILLALKFSN